MVADLIQSVACRALIPAGFTQAYTDLIIDGTTNTNAPAHLPPARMSATSSHYQRDRIHCSARAGLRLPV
jgi:hypothetical protein